MEVGKLQSYYCAALKIPYCHCSQLPILNTSDIFVSIPTWLFELFAYFGQKVWEKIHVECLVVKEFLQVENLGFEIYSKEKWKP